MISSDSLFDNNINSSQQVQDLSSLHVPQLPMDQTVHYSDENEHHDQQQQQQQQIQQESSIDESFDLDLGKSLITYRVLVSRREAGAIIGKEGSNISNLREKYDVKAGVSKVVDGCIDRILTISGIVDHISEALVSVAQSVLDANLSTIQESEENGTNPTRLISYEYPPLRPLAQRPDYQSEEYKTNLFLRLLIPNSQIGTLIGKQGV